MGKRAVMIWLCAALLCALLPLSALAEGGASPSDLPDAAAQPAADSGERPFTPGVWKDPLTVDYPVPRRKLLRGATATDLPSAYRSDCTPVGDQGSSSLCWDFSALAVMETWLLKHTGQTHDFSEMHMAYATSRYGGNTVYGEKRSPGAGALRKVSSAYLMRGMPEGDCAGGAVPEALDPYSTGSLGERSASVTLTGKPKQYAPVNIYYLCGYKADGDGVSDTVIKQAVYDYGAVAADLDFNGDDNGSTAYYNEEYGAYYRYVESDDVDHEMTIVGWDDDYPAANFKGTQPPGDGAWLVKNSYGTGKGKGENGSGFYWISYYDTVFPSAAYTFDGVRAYDSTVQYTYEYDFTAYDGMIKPYAGTGLFLRYFRAREATAVTEVKVFLASADCTVEVDVVPHVDPDAEGIVPADYTFRPRAAVRNHFPGWYTVTLDTPVPLEKDQCFGVVIRTDAKLGYDTDNPGKCGDADAAGDGPYLWNYEKNSKGWCIKAVTDTTVREYAELTAYFSEEDARIWELIRGGNPSPDDVRYDLAVPGDGPFHSTFAYVSSDPLIDEEGRVTRPDQGQSAAEVTLEVVLTWHDRQWTLPVTVQVTPCQHRRGDCNGDDTADVTDLACLFTFLSTGRMEGALAEDGAYFRTIADVNRNKTVDILDYQALYAALREIP